MPKHMTVTSALGRKEGGLYLTLTNPDLPEQTQTVALPTALPEHIKGLKGGSCPPLRFLAGVDSKGALSIPHAELVVAAASAADAAPASQTGVLAEVSRDTDHNRRMAAIAYLELAIRTESVPLPAKKPDRLLALHEEFKKILSEMP